MKINTNTMKIEIDVRELLCEIHDHADEFDITGLLEDFGWMDKIRKNIIEELKSSYASDSMSPSLHKEREELLMAMKDREIEYYARQIAGKMEDCSRWQDVYFKVWHWCCDNDIKYNNFPDTEKIDFDFRKQLEEMVIKKMKMEAK